MEIFDHSHQVKTSPTSTSFSGALIVGGGNGGSGNGNNSNGGTINSNNNNSKYKKDSLSSQSLNVAQPEEQKQFISTINKIIETDKINNNTPADDDVIIDKKQLQKQQKQQLKEQREREKELQREREREKDKDNNINTLDDNNNNNNNNSYNKSIDNNNNNNNTSNLESNNESSSTTTTTSSSSSSSSHTHPHLHQFNESINHLVDTIHDKGDMVVSELKKKIRKQMSLARGRRKRKNKEPAEQQDPLKESFSIDIGMMWLLQSIKRPAIQEHVCERITKLPHTDFQLFLPQIVHVCVEHKQEPIIVMLLEKCKSSLVIAVQTFFLLNSFASDQHPETIDSAKLLWKRCELASIGMIDAALKLSPKYKQPLLEESLSDKTVLIIDEGYFESNSVEAANGQDKHVVNNFGSLSSSMADQIKNMEEAEAARNNLKQSSGSGISSSGSHSSSSNRGSKVVSEVDWIGDHDSESPIETDGVSEADNHSSINEDNYNSTSNSNTSLQHSHHLGSDNYQQQQQQECKQTFSKIKSVLLGDSLYQYTLKDWQLPVDHPDVEWRSRQTTGTTQCNAACHSEAVERPGIRAIQHHPPRVPDIPSDGNRPRGSGLFELQGACSLYALPGGKDE
ncbi:phosphatidylinositol 4-kinase [Heterostelium album PN500]|uniref:Phosphatidylinositol 4-kinase n=1 Tax=Heterostelium pallidum (strain ATCC 26659 / Pp 5 / PN500) TaxID=670386 RepID=D3AXB3_HETP5|nr:phosphatidylinositol 4-kinase [Heterostelium album PN500]EFA86182.1 phosphatidylinositol 4-kinase [Heterostelium album PN500]|eukprot:XP_020438287.1 phosphatidylinositol 4-kinase [Heterostelium album PN500]